MAVDARAFIRQKLGKTVPATPTQVTNPTNEGARAFIRNKLSGKTAAPIEPKPTSIKRLPPFLGGGEFDMNTAYPRPQSERSQNAIGAPREGYQRDHNIPFSLGGTNTKRNLSFTPEKTAKARDKFITELNRDIRAGKISRQEAMVKVNDFYMNLETKANPVLDAAAGVGEFIEGMGKGFVEDVNTLTKIPAAIASKDKPNNLQQEVAEKSASARRWIRQKLGLKTTTPEGTQVFRVGENMTPEQTEAAKSVITKNIEAAQRTQEFVQNESMIAPVMAKTPGAESARSLVTLPFRWTIGSLAKFATNVGLEAAGSDFSRTPQFPLEEDLFGATDWQRVSNASDLYGAIENVVAKKLESKGVKPELANRLGLVPVLAVGSILENPGFGAGKKAAKEALERGLKEMVEKELGRTLTEQETKQIASEVPTILGIKDVAKRQEAVASTILSVKQGVPFVAETDARAFIRQKLGKEPLQPSRIVQDVPGGSNMPSAPERASQVPNIQPGAAPATPTPKVKPLSEIQDRAMTNLGTAARQIDQPQPAMSYVGELARTRRDADEIQKTIAGLQNVDASVKARMTKIQSIIKKREEDLFGAKLGLTDEAGNELTYPQYQAELKKQFEYEDTMARRFDNEEMENSFQRFRELARRRKWMLDPTTDQAALKAKLKDKFPDLDNVLFVGGDGMTNDEMLDAFKARYVEQRDASPASLSFLKRFSSRSSEVSAAEERLRTANDEFRRLGSWEKASKASVDALEKRAAALENLQTALKVQMEGYRDITNIGKGLKDVWRNTRQVFGKDYAKVKADILDPLAAGKEKYVNSILAGTNRLRKEIVEKLGIKKGSKESAAVQLFGEKKLTQLELVSKFGSEKADRIIEAADWFRREYDEWLDRINAVRAEIYPNQPDKLIKKRDDYFRHFHEMQDGIAALRNILDLPAAIDPRLSGISEGTKPKSKWLSIAQKREGEQTTVDAIGGYLNYLNAGAYAESIDPVTARIRQFRNDLAEATVETRNLNNYLAYLDHFANDLAGKTMLIDRVISEFGPGGRMAMKAISWLNNRIKANIILGNVSSSIAQIMNVPQAIVTAGPRNSILAARDMVGRLLLSAGKEGPEANSAFLRERFKLRSALDQFDTSMLKQPKRFAVWMTSALDQVGTTFAWLGQYRKAIAEGVADPAKMADEVTRSLVAGRGVGEVPLLQKSQLVQIVAPFQLEAQNLWYVMGDIIRDAPTRTRAVGRIVTLLAWLHAFNKAAEQVRGSGAAFDPIEALQDGLEAANFEESNLEKAKVIFGRQIGELTSNVMFGGVALDALNTLPFLHLDKEGRERVYGNTDPKRFGGGLLLGKGVADPLVKVLPPFAGVQAYKSVMGVQALREGEVRNAGGKKQFDVEVDPENIIRAILFGKYGVSEALDDNQVKELIRKAQASGSAANRKRADEIRKEADRIMSLSAPDMRQALLTIANEDEATARKIIESIKDAKAGLTATDRQLKSLGVENGARAELIYELMLQKSQGERQAFLLDLANKKILSEDVVRQIAQIKKDRGD